MLYFRSSKCLLDGSENYLDVVIFVGERFVPDKEVEIVAASVNTLSYFGSPSHPNGRGNDVLWLQGTGVTHLGVAERNKNHQNEWIEHIKFFN